MRFIDAFSAKYDQVYGHGKYAAIKPAPILPMRDNVQARVIVRPPELGGVKLKVTFPVTCSIRNVTRTMSRAWFQGSWT
jgi:hypothetical protein